MQRTCVLLAAAGIACAPLGCQTVSDVFNEPPAEPQRTEREAEREAEERAERAERVDRDDEDVREARRERMERMEEEREEARRERRERREDRREARREARRDAEERAERAGERSRSRLARDYVAASSCPVAVDGARVSMVDIVDGIALEFTAEREEDTDAVRERARRLMRTQREVRSARDVDDPELEALPPARVEYDVQPEGARIEFKVERESDLRDLRAQLRERMDILRDEGECPRDFMTMRTRSEGRAG